jgi:hypothetical protein
MSTTGTFPTISNIYDSRNSHVFRAFTISFKRSSFGNFQNTLNFGTLLLHCHGLWNIKNIYKIIFLLIPSKLYPLSYHSTLTSLSSSHSQSVWAYEEAPLGKSWPYRTVLSQERMQLVNTPQYPTNIFTLPHPVHSSLLLTYNMIIRWSS